MGKTLKGSGARFEQKQEPIFRPGPAKKPKPFGPLVWLGWWNGIVYYYVGPQRRVLSQSNSFILISELFLFLTIIVLHDCMYLFLFCYHSNLTRQKSLHA
ncbi:hypothetical protein Ancab_008789 [Ancistrocladus abbreviatus]